MRQQFEYKGRTIDVRTRKIGRGWVWIYQIDSGPLREGLDRALPDEELALKEGVEVAKREIDG